MKYANIVTVQGDDYAEAEAAADVAASRAAGEYGVVAGRYTGCREWVDALFAHLVQWDMGEATSDDVFGDGTELHMLAHPSDRNAALYAADGTPLPSVAADPHYVLTWDVRHCVAALHRRPLPDA